MKHIELEIGVELQVFNSILVDPEKITVLPKGFYEKFFEYMIQEEMYEHIHKLESIKHKISNKTFDEIIKN